MEQYERDSLVAQIIADVMPIAYGKTFYFYNTPSARDISFSHQIYDQTLAEAIDAGAFTDKQMTAWMIDQGLWTRANEELIKKLSDEIPNIKVKIYELRAHKAEQLLARKALIDTKDKIESLIFERSAFDHLTCQGLAASARFRFIVGASLTNASGKRYWREPWKNWRKPDYRLNHIIVNYNQIRLNEQQIRELSRNNPWREYWYASERSGRGIFDRPSSLLSPYQISLIMYSRFYDNLMQSPECPPDEVINDDDCLDGWVILQKRNEDKEAKKTNILDSITNDSIREASEVFVMSKNEEQPDMPEIDDIQGLNDVAGMIAFKQRMTQIKQEGVVNELDLNETRLNMQMQAAQQFSQRLKGH